LIEGYFPTGVPEVHLCFFALKNSVHDVAKTEADNIDILEGI